MPGTENYTHDIWHWSQLATQPSNCSVEPGTAEDVGTIVSLHLFVCAGRLYRDSCPCSFKYLTLQGRLSPYAFLRLAIGLT